MTDRDKRSLIILIVFSVITVYYLFFLDPMLLKQSELDKELKSLTKEYSLTRRKVRETRAWKKDFDEKALNAANFKEELNKKLMTAAPSELIREILRIATISKVSIENIKPRVKREKIEKQSEDSDVKPTIVAAIEDTWISLNGNGAYVANLIFISKLGGLKIESLNLNKDEKTGNFKIVMLLKQLNINTISNIELPKIKKKIIVKPKVVEKKKEKMKTVKKNIDINAPKKKSSTYLNLSKYKLLGTAGVDEKLMAIIKYGTPEEINYLWKDEVLGGLRLSLIDSKGIELTRDKDGVKGRINFPKETGIKFGEIEKSKTEIKTTKKTLPTKQGKLGLKLGQITEIIKEQYKFNSIKGLYVIKGRGGSNPILKGDIIRSINGTDINTILEAKQVLRHISVGDNIVLNILRNQTKRKIAINAL